MPGLCGELLFQRLSVPMSKWPCRRGLDHDFLKVNSRLPLSVEPIRYCTYTDGAKSLRFLDDIIVSHVQLFTQEREAAIEAENGVRDRKRRDGNSTAGPAPGPAVAGPIRSKLMKSEQYVTALFDQLATGGRVMENRGRR